MVLQLLFGMTMSSVAKCLQFSRRILVKILRKSEIAKFLFHLMISCKSTGESLGQDSSIEQCWCTKDGLKCQIENDPD